MGQVRTSTRIWNIKKNLKSSKTCDNKNSQKILVSKNKPKGCNSEDIINNSQ